MLSTPFFSARQAATKNGQLGQSTAMLASNSNHRSSRSPKGGAGGSNSPPMGE